MIIPFFSYRFSAALLSISLLIASNIFAQETQQSAEVEPSKDPRVDRICSDQPDNENCKALDKAEGDLAANRDLMRGYNKKLKQLTKQLSEGTIEAVDAETKLDDLRKDIKKAEKIITDSNVAIVSLRKQIKRNNPE